VNVQRLVTPEKEVRNPIAAVYNNVTSTEKVSDEKLTWEEVLCEINMDTQTVAELQRSLQKAGVYDGPIDGIYGRMTERAANSYAKQNGLPTGSRLIALKTVKHLGLKIILKATSKLGEYLFDSMALTVCLVTPTKSANSF